MRPLLAVVLTPCLLAMRVEDASVENFTKIGVSKLSLGKIGTLDSQQCVTDIRHKFCCSTRKGLCKDHPARTKCDDTKGMDCDWTFKGRKCKCQSNHCYDEATNSCVNRETLPVTVGPAKSRSVKSVKVEDFLDSISSGMLAGGKALGSGVADVTGSALNMVTSPFQSMGKEGALYFSGVYAGSKLNSNIDEVEGFLQYVLASFVLSNDNPSKSCNTKRGPLGIAGSRPDYGHCYFPLANDDGQPLWEGPLFPYSDGRGNDFNISLKVKAGQVRGLEALQVQSSRCFGNVVSNGGLCKLELSPSGRDGETLAVTDLEVEIFCEGKCSIQDQVLGALQSDDAIEVGKNVYIYKPGSKRYGDKCRSERKTILRNFVRCDPHGKKCLRHCLADSRGQEWGCWHTTNLLTEKQWRKECEGYLSAGARMLGRRLASWMGGSTDAKHSRVTLLYRKFNAKLTDIKVRTDVYIFRTRSLVQVVNEDEDSTDDSSRNLVAQGLNMAFGGISKAMNLIAHPMSATKSQLDLIKKYKFNLQPKKYPNGTVEGFELVSCNQFVWNEETEDYDLPPLKKCQKIRLVNLELLATKPDYLEVEEITAEQGNAVAGSPGIVLSIVAKLARMMFVRFAVSMRAPDDKDGSPKYCKDMWTKRNAEEKEKALGVLCASDNMLKRDQDEVGDGVDARYQFEAVELKPMWDNALKRNFQYLGLRGGYNLQFCRVLSARDPSTGLAPGSVVCDLDAPEEEGTQQVKGGSLPAEARFRLEHIGRNNVASTISIGGASSAEASCENCEEKSEETVQQEVNEELTDGADVDNDLRIRLYSLGTGKYCRVRTQVFDGFFFDKKKKLLVCDSDIELTPDRQQKDDFTELQLLLTGNTDGLIPNQYWNFIIVLSLSCLGATAGFTGGKWAALLGGAGMVATFTTVVGGAATGAAAGYYITEYLSNNYHLDGIMLRYLLNVKMQALGQQILYAIEGALDFELPRP